MGYSLSCMVVVSSFSIYAITERSEMGLYDVPMFMSLLGLGMYDGC